MKPEEGAPPRKDEPDQKDNEKKPGRQRTSLLLRWGDLQQSAGPEQPQLTVVQPEESPAPQDEQQVAFYLRRFADTAHLLGKAPDDGLNAVQRVRVVRGHDPYDEGGP